MKATNSRKHTSRDLYVLVEEKKKPVCRLAEAKREKVKTEKTKEEKKEDRDGERERPYCAGAKTPIWRLDFFL